MIYLNFTNLFLLKFRCIINYAVLFFLTVLLYLASGFVAIVFLLEYFKSTL